MSSFDLGDWAAFYAAVVATGALFLEIGRWFESRAKLSISVMPEGKVVNQLGMQNDKSYIFVSVSNRGGQRDNDHYGSWCRRLLNKPEKTFVVPNPGSAERVPYLLVPGGTWSGMAEHGAETRALLAKGDLWVHIIAAHRNRDRSNALPTAMPSSMLSLASTLRRRAIKGTSARRKAQGGRHGGPGPPRALFCG